MALLNFMCFYSFIFMRLDKSCTKSVEDIDLIYFLIKLKKSYVILRYLNTVLSVKGLSH